MITIRNYNFDYYRYLAILSSFILFGILLKTFDKRPYVLLETGLLITGLLFCVIIMIGNKQRMSNNSLIFISFLMYLFLYNLTYVFLRTIEVDVSLYYSLFFSIQEFRLSSLGYLLPLLFIPLNSYEKEKIIDVFVLLAKISVAYTIFEQLISSLGYRSFFEALYQNSGVVSENQIGLKSFGIYRVFGLIGSPQILGIFHLLTLALLLYKQDKLWAYLSVLAVFLSTSKTAILMLVLLILLYFFAKRKYLLLLIAIIAFSLVAVTLNEINSHLVDKHSNDYPHLQKFVQSIQGYFLLSVYKLDYLTAETAKYGGYYINETGPLIAVKNYFAANPLELLFGIGITYSFLHAPDLANTPFNQVDLKVADQFYMGLSSDFYILTYFEQYGIVGFLFLTIIYFIYPLILMLKKHSFIFYMPIIFYLSCFHYPPQISKIIMLFLGLSIWLIYFKKNDNKVNSMNKVPLR